MRQMPTEAILSASCSLTIDLYSLTHVGVEISGPTFGLSNNKLLDFFNNTVWCLPRNLGAPLGELGRYFSTNGHLSHFAPFIFLFPTLLLFCGPDFAPHMAGCVAV